MNSFIDSLDWSTQLLSDFPKVWLWILAMAGISIVISFLWLLFLRFLSLFFAYLIFFLGIAVSVGSCVLFEFWWMEKTEGSSSHTFSFLSLQLILYLVAFVVLVIFSFSLILITIFIRKRIKNSVKLIKEANVAVKDIPSLIFLPILFSLVYLKSFMLVSGISLCILANH